jgi:predicted  nucleic acid-binding Zn-ribbon protein
VLISSSEVNKLKNKIGDLIRLQDCDNRIKEILNRKSEGPLRIKKLEDELNAIERKFQEEYNRFESLKKNRRKVDQEIQDLEDRIEKSNIKLSNIKSNKEYKAALKEIDDLKRAKFLTEDRALQVMEEIEDLEKICQENKDKQVEIRKKFDKDKNEIERELEVLDEELQIIEKTRTILSQTIDQELLKRYLFLKERKEGQAISPVIGGVCQICHMGIPPQKYNELIKGSSLLTCTNCSRIIYWAEDEHFQEALNKV